VSFRYALLLFFLSAFAASGLRSRALDVDGTLASRVIVLANASDPESVKLAHYYAERRTIPTENIIALPMPTDETIEWRTLIDAIYQPLQDELIRREWIEGIPFSANDALGRKKYAISGNHISYLVVCRGVPLRVNHDQSLYTPVAPVTDTSQFRTNCGAVDSELSLLARSGYPINAFFPNPLFAKDHPTTAERTRVVKVSRLDGPSYADAAALVDHAIEGEKNGLIGRAYVDLGGPIPEGDAWLEHTVNELKDLNFDLVVDREGATFPSTARFDAPAFYFGWYAGELCGPLAQPDFHFPPGAIALHIHSFSAQTLHSTTSNWCGPLVARGVTATFGNVFEPYLQFTPQPHLIMKALARGDNLGDAAYYAIMALSWQEVVIGDPLYQPFAVSFADQWVKRESLPDSLYPYVVLREMRRLESAGQVEPAIEVGQAAQKKRASVVVAVPLARLLKEEGRITEAVRGLRSEIKLEQMKAGDVTLFNEAALFLSENGEGKFAAKIFQALVQLQAISGDMRNLLWKNAGKNDERMAAIRSGTPAPLSTARARP
jgi:uncharacterized protein (TIGR03790 family)